MKDKVKVTRIVELNLTAHEWGMYAEAFDDPEVKKECEAAAQRLNKDIERIINSSYVDADCYRLCQQVMYRKEYSKWGTADTEGRYAMHDVLVLSGRFADEKSRANWF